MERPQQGLASKETLSYGGESPAETPETPRRTLVSGLERGSKVRRYIVLDRVGEGGMGVVYAAYDPSLDRRVALKFIAPRDPGRDGLHEVRLLREAQAMARLSHPNVAVVYEVGSFHGHTFVSMEFVKGADLRAWLSSAPRSQSQIIDVFLAAGRGLAAAHAAGIVHRDFKPENVLVDDQDRPRVTDFGLSRSSRDTAKTEAEQAEHDTDGVARPSHLATPLTEEGRVLGTPAYMAPEQHRGIEADTRADQFAYCVALYEALHGVRPFAGEGPAEIAEAIAARRFTTPTTEVPGWLRAVVKRGLEPEPRDRWPSMDALLGALGRDPRATRRRWLLGGAAAAGLVAVASLWLTRPESEICTPARDRVAAIWDAQARQKVRAAFLATGESRAPDVFGRAERALDARLSKWVDAHREACVATRVRGEQSEAMLDLRMQCLERARRQMAGLPEAWQTDVKLDEAVRAALTVGELDACSDAEALSGPVPPPRDPQAVHHLEMLRRELDRLAALRRAGQWETARPRARQAVQQARRLGYAPLLAEALQRSGEIEVDSGEGAAGIDLLHEAFRAANVAHDDPRAATASRLLLHYAVVNQGRMSDADLLWRMAEAAQARVAAHEDLLADLLHTEGAVLWKQGKKVEAAERLRRAVALTAKAHPGDEFALANHVKTLGSIVADMGRTDEAIALTERARAAWEGTLGPVHPSVGLALQNLALLQRDKGDFESATGTAERGLAIRSTIFPADHPEVATALRTLAEVHLYDERDDEARGLFEQAARIQEKALGPEHPALASTRNHLAELAVRRGDTATARTLIGQVLPVKRKAYGEQHETFGYAQKTLGGILLLEKKPGAARAAYQNQVSIQLAHDDEQDAATALEGLGDVALFEGRPGDAIAQFERARQMLDKRPEEINRFLVMPVLTGLGRAHLAAGHKRESIAILERAIAQAASNGAPSRIAGARARFQLARALWLSGERVRAAALARAARDVLARQPEAGQIDRWLQKHAR